MKITELKKVIDMICVGDPNVENIECVVDLDEPSVGPSAGSFVTSVSLGFDWDTNRFRIQCADKLVRKSNIKCPKCEKSINKSDKFCRYCGAQLRNF